eukprot:scaffold741_cov336-Pavlova_lutheri.AAC.47
MDGTNVVEMAEERDRNRLKVLVATDNHLGYLEKDEVRGQDSFRAFEEIFQHALECEVDLVLLGGDLFHHNKPSQSTIVKCMQVIQKYCLGEKPIKFQVVSDQATNFPGQGGCVNFENPNLNVAMPIFIVHGNHDDPAGAENLSALDILASCNLVNYFGKSSLTGQGTGKVRLNPVLIRKGETKMALYGIGHIRDERLHRMFEAENVEWIRPKSTETCCTEDWFNVFVIHQNRVAHNPKNCIPEAFLPSFLDFVIWGHEHECLVEPQETAHFSVTQPGSSVATSLMEGESCAKHVLLLEVMKFGDDTTKWRTTKIPLKTVRPFEFRHLILKDELPPGQKDTAVIESVLRTRVEEMIAAAFSGSNSRDGKEMLPLIRLRVDYTGFTTVNTQRFGQQFVGKVANPQDILFFTKSNSRKVKVDEQDPTAKDETCRPELLDQETIEALIAENLTQQLQILGENELGIALHNFVDKDERNALGMYLKEKLQTMSKVATANPSTGPNSITELVAGIAQAQKQASASPYVSKLVGNCNTPMQNPAHQGTANQAAGHGHCSVVDQELPLDPDISGRKNTRLKGGRNGALPLLKKSPADVLKLDAEVFSEGNAARVKRAERSKVNGMAEDAIKVEADTDSENVLTLGESNQVPKPRKSKRGSTSPAVFKKPTPRQSGPVRKPTFIDVDSDEEAAEQESREIKRLKSKPVSDAQHSPSWNGLE